ncbi:hypothetical protein FACS1894190_00420 [Spirochaetia bacterium]|nr:hypothetical protein FACS1894190_00420 [Spirochaetia bacterium]
MKMNKLFIMGVLAAILIVLGTVNVMAQVTPPDSDFEVTQNKDGKTITIKEYKGSAKDIIIPTTLYGLPVTVIGAGSFAGKSLTNVVIPEGVITIESPIVDRWGNHVSTNGAFKGNQLSSVTIPDSVTTIGDFAFDDNQLTSVTLGNSVITIGTGSFCGIMHYTFREKRNKLTSVVIPNSVTTIGKEAFYGNQLTSLTLGNSVTTIKEGAFLDNQLTSLIIPDSVITIEDSSGNSGHGVFRGNKLTSITLGKGINIIGEYAFADNNLTSVTIPDSVTTIRANAFRDNPLKTLVLGSGLVAIGNNSPFVSGGAFYGNQLISITIAKDVPGSQTFLGDLYGRIDTKVGFEESFINFYESQSRTPGTYVKNGPIWSKK